MAINIFVGARRLAVILGVLATVFVMVGISMLYSESSAYYSASYSLASPNSSLKRRDTYCPDILQTVIFNHSTSRGKNIIVSICLELMTFKNKAGEEIELVPYRVDEQGMVWGAQPFSDEIAAYRKKVEKNFTMSAIDEEVSSPGRS